MCFQLPSERFYKLVVFIHTYCHCTAQAEQPKMRGGFGHCLEMESSGICLSMRHRGAAAGPQADGALTVVMAGVISSTTLVLLLSFLCLFGFALS